MYQPFNSGLDIGKEFEIIEIFLCTFDDMHVQKCIIPFLLILGMIELL